ncbi:DUF1206 domain-containing protein [Streptomyces sp. NPDC091272]|uniref:DUF1206 domain-containing protein n=1 Tax=Streptomyces sp. NPDC091272 TaxID=3365981 RepID=UPI00382B4663
MNATSATGTARRAARSDTMKHAARAGFTARGVIHLLIGVLALQIALGGGGKSADQGGALAEIAEKPFGKVLLWALGIGLAAMALWQLTEALFGSVGPDGDKPRKRLLAGGLFVFYGFVSYSVLAFAVGSKSSGGGASDKESQDVTAKAMGLPAGQWLVGLVALVVVGAGLWIAVQAIRRKYHKEMKMGEMSRRTRQLVDVTGVGGGAARGLVFAVAGGFAVQAAVTFDPNKAKGMDDTIRSFRETPAGPWLLVVLAIGLMLFGVFSFAMARWRKL